MKHLIPHLPQYRILGQIGEGQFGQVYCAIHRKTGQLFAIKRLDRKGFPANQFIRELSFLLSLNHPNIVSCSGMLYEKEGRYLITDYCEGGTLRDLMESGGELALSYRIKLIIDVLRGLSYAHSQKVVHCDLKPENILLITESQGWRAKITDFGIARLLEIDNTNTGRGYTGSPAYMAPERFYGRFSIHSDIYAMGIILYEILTGKRPFSGLPGQLMIAHLNQRVDIPQNMPVLLKPIVLKAVEKLPQRRYQTAELMLKDLENVLKEIHQSVSLPYLRLSPQIPASSCQLKLLRQTSLTYPITHLAVKDRYLYFGSNHQLWCQTYPDSRFKGNPSQEWKLEFPEDISLLKICPQGCFILTKGTSETKLYQVPYKPLSAYAVAKDFLIQAWEAVKFTFTLDPQGHWLGMVYRPTMDKSSTVFQLLKLPDFTLIKPPKPFSYPVHLIIIDSHHGLAFILYEKGNQHQTRMTLFNRRGMLIKGEILPFGISQITANLDLAYCLFSVELDQPQIGVLIHLKPWKITRIVLEIKIAFVLSHPQGFCVADTQGTIIILDEKGSRMGQCHLAIEGKVTAIAFTNPYQLLLTTWGDTQGHIYHLDIKEIIEFKEED